MKIKSNSKQNGQKIQKTQKDKKVPYRTKQCRTKLLVGQNFRHLRKISSFLSDEKFCPFSKFEIS